VASYEGLYGGLAEEDERIAAYGKLEEVADGRVGQRYHRVLVGSKEGEGKD
jgi:predicted nucleotidyltransferase